MKAILVFFLLTLVSCVDNQQKNVFQLTGYKIHRITTYPENCYQNSIYVTCLIENKSDTTIDIVSSDSSNLSFCFKEADSKLFTTKGRFDMKVVNLPSSIKPHSTTTFDCYLIGWTFSGSFEQIKQDVAKRLGTLKYIQLDSRIQNEGIRLEAAKHQKFYYELNESTPKQSLTPAEKNEGKVTDGKLIKIINKTLHFV